MFKQFSGMFITYAGLIFTFVYGYPILMQHYITDYYVYIQFGLGHAIHICMLHSNFKHVLVQVYPEL